MSGRILVVEDDERISSSMRLALEGEGYEVKDAASGEEGLDLFAEAPTDVALIDLMLPGMDGFECCRALRRSSAVPIIIVTARARTPTTWWPGSRPGRTTTSPSPSWPRSWRRGSARLLRRARPAEEEPGALTFGDLQLLPEQGVLRRLNGDEVHCTRTEFRLLCELAAIAQQGAEPRAAPRPGLGLRLLRRRPSGRRPHPAPAHQGRGRPGGAPAHPHREGHGLQAGPLT